jgi:hypothetical protein
MQTDGIQWRHHSVAAESYTTSVVLLCTGENWPSGTVFILNSTVRFITVWIWQIDSDSTQNEWTNNMYRLLIEHWAKILKLLQNLTFHCYLSITHHLSESLARLIYSIFLRIHLCYPNSALRKYKRRSSFKINQQHRCLLTAQLRT